MEISLTAPVQQAIARTQAILFRPFSAEKWFVLGFCAFLAQLGEGGGAAHWRLPGGWERWDRAAGGPALRELRAAAAWVQEHLAVIATAGAVLLLVGLAVAVLLLWLRARGTFLLLDGVVRDRAAVAEPWREYAAEAGSLFRFDLALAFGGLALFLLLAGGALALAWPELRMLRFGPRSALALLGSIPLALLLAIALAVVQLLRTDFLAPAMYLHRLGVAEAWPVVREEVLEGRLGLLVLYVLMKIALAIGIGLVAALAVCLTCCLAALPYLGTVILLPLHVFARAYPLCFLAQFGGRWRRFDPALPAT